MRKWLRLPMVAQWGKTYTDSTATLTIALRREGNYGCPLQHSKKHAITFQASGLKLKDDSNYDPHFEIRGSPEGGNYVRKHFPDNIPGTPPHSPPTPTPPGPPPSYMVDLKVGIEYSLSEIGL